MFGYRVRLEAGTFEAGAGFASSPQKKARAHDISLYQGTDQAFLEAVYQAPCPHRLEFFLALFCGLQPGEILGLTYDDFNPDTCILSVRKHYIKNHLLPQGFPDTAAGNWKSSAAVLLRSLISYAKSLFSEKRRTGISFLPVPQGKKMGSSASAAMGR